MALHRDTGKLILPPAIASVSAILSLLMINYPDHFSGVAILLMPGFIVAMIAANNVHDFNPWVAAVANFGVYFGASFLFWQIWNEYFRPKGGN